MIILSWIFVFVLMNMCSLNVWAKSSPEEAAQAFKNTYAIIAQMNYGEALAKAQEFQQLEEDFKSRPSQQGLEDLRKAWINSRPSYGQSEVFRFVDGPIDGVNEKGEEGPEGRLNAWPLNEAYIDYVKGDPKAGIIADLTVPLNTEMIVKRNQQDDEADVSTGYHAIEFLLWGQDFNPSGPGQRPSSDFEGEGKVQERRREYLSLITKQLNDDLGMVNEAWSKTGFYYQGAYQALKPMEVVQKALNSLATLSGFELASERMATALDSGDQEDEHSCFSDTTHLDFIANAQGVDNVYYGRYGSYKGKGLHDLAILVDAALAKKIDAQLTITRNLVKSLKPPIDQILASSKDAPERLQLEALVKSLQKQAELFVLLGKVLGIDVVIKNS